MNMFQRRSPYMALSPSFFFFFVVARMKKMETTFLFITFFTTRVWSYFLDGLSL